MEENTNVKYCHECGVKIPSGVKFCPNCGAKQLAADQPENKAIETSTETLSESSTDENKSKKPKSAKIVAIVLATLLLVAVAIIGGIKLKKSYDAEIIKIEASYKGSTEEGTLLDSSNKNITVKAQTRGGETCQVDEWKIDTPKTLVAEETSKVTIKYNNLSCELSVECTTLTKEHYLSNCQEYNYDDVNRNADALNGNYIKFKGKILQILNQSGYSILRVNDKGSSNVYYVEFVGEVPSSRVIEGDYITVYGVLNGMKTYTTTMNSQITIPLVISKYIDPEQKTKELEKYTIHDISDGVSYVKYTAGDGTGSSKTYSGYIASNWAVAYDGATSKNYSKMTENFYVPEGVTPDRFSKFTNLFTLNSNEYEWRGVHTVINFNKRVSSSIFIVSLFADYYTQKFYDNNADSSHDYTACNFSVEYNGKKYNDCKCIDYGIFTDSYTLELYTFYKVPKGYDGCLIAYPNSQGIKDFGKHINNVGTLVDNLGPDPVILRLR